MQTRLILWGALLASTFIYLVILQVTPHPAPEGGPDPMLPLILAVVSVGLAVFSYWFPAQATKKALLAKNIPTEASPSFGDLPAGTKVFVNSLTARDVARPLYMTPMIIKLALRESIAIYGLVLGFTGHPMRTYIGFFVIAWLLMLEGFPRQAADDAALESAYGAKLT